MTIASLIVDVAANTVKLQQDVAKIDKSLGGIVSMAGKVASALGIGFSISQVVSFGLAILEDVNALKKMSDMTGLSVEGLQRLQVAGDDAGNSLGEITNAIVKMEDKIASGDKSAASALATLNLSFDALRGRSPEDQFIAISDAIRTIDDPAQQVQLSIDIFGKQGATILPTLKRGFDDLRDSAVGMSADTVEALDQVGDAMDRASRTAKGQFAEHFAFLFLGWGKADREAVAFARTLDKITGIAAKAAPVVKGLAPPGLPADLARIEAELAKQHTTLVRHREAAEKAAETQKKLAQDFADSVVSLTSSSIGAVQAFGAYGALMPDLSGRAKELMEQLRLLPAVVTDSVGMLPSVVPQATAAIRDATTETEKLVDKTTGIQDLAASFAQLAQISGDSFGGIVKDIAQVVGALALAERAADNLKEGGGLVQFAIAGVGAMDAATKSTSRTTATLGGMATGMKLGASIAGPYGAVIGAAAGALVGFFRSAGAAERAINPLREQFVQLHGGLHALNLKAAEAGVTLTAMLNAKNPEQYKKAIDDLNLALNLQAQDVADLDAAIAEYGFSIEELGPAMQRQQLDTQAAKLLNKWRLLVDSGIDITVVNERMAGTMNEYLAMAARTGTEVPAAMQPILQTMIDQGTLLDENGVAITDLGGIGVTFSETMTQGFDRIVLKLSELLDKIGLVPAAVNAIPTNHTIHIGYQYDAYDPPNQDSHYAAMGGLVTSTGIQYFGSGGHVLPFRARGTDTVPAMLTPGERVLNLRETKAYNAGAARGGSWDMSELRALRAAQETFTRYMTGQFAKDNARAIRDEVQKVARR